MSAADEGCYADPSAKPLVRAGRARGGTLEISRDLRRVCWLPGASLAPQTLANIDRALWPTAAAPIRGDVDTLGAHPSGDAGCHLEPGAMRPWCGRADV